MMEGRVRRITRQKLSHFILGEEGKVGSRSAFVAATVVGATSLATMLLGVAQNAKAGSWCGVLGQCPDATPICCFYAGPPNQYHCTDVPIAGWQCW
ncbi:hypothetical protein GF312_07435 [Candidatus Poribacteria bacterium]|nr:hypothetical protein [Candidatus Poribacteria bacterium]